MGTVPASSFAARERARTQLFAGNYVIVAKAMIKG